MEKKENLKVVFLSINVFGTTIGGVENHIYYLSKELASMGIKVDIVQPIPNDKNSFEVVSFGSITLHKLYLKVPFYSLFKGIEKFHSDTKFGMLLAFVNKFKCIFCAKEIAKYIETLSPDIIHQHDYISNIFTTKILSKKFKTVLTNHTGEYLILSKIFLTRKIQEKLLSHFDFVIGPSRELTPKQRNALYIPNGVDIDFFYPLGEEEIKLKKRKMGYNGEFVILCPRRWAPTKGIIYLAKAIKLLDGELPRNVVFLFAGSDYEGYQEYRKKVNSILSSCSAKVRNLGNLDQLTLRNFYQISDLTVIPSLMEATSLAALEAMACGCPILSTNVGGMPEIIREDYNGWMVEPMSDVVLANKIKELYEILKNQRRKREIRKNCREFVVEQYDWGRIAEKTVEIYNKLMEKKNNDKENPNY